MPEPRWVELPQFIPFSKEYYQKLQGFQPIRKSTVKSSTAKGLNEPKRLTEPRHLNERQKLSKLIECLAISEIEKKKLQEKMNDLERYRIEMDLKVETLKKEKQDLINQQKLVTLTKIDVPQNQVMETKLVEIQKEIEKLSVSLPAISRVLNQVEQDVKHIPDKITIQVPVVSVPVPAPIEVPVPVQMPVPVAVETPPPAPIPQAQPAPPVEPIPIPLSLPNPPIPHPAPQEPITTSPEDPSTRSIFSLTDQVKSEDIPSLELLLKRILKKPSKDRIDQLQKDIEKVKHVGTSPPSSHIARDLEKRYKKSKKGETSRISWICPGCITDSSQSISIPKQSKMMLNNINELKPKDSSMLFANDTSMIHPLAQIVAELENEQNEMDLDDLEVLSSLNGF